MAPRRSRAPSAGVFRGTRARVAPQLHHALGGLQDALVLLGIAPQEGRMATAVVDHHARLAGPRTGAPRGARDAVGDRSDGPAEPAAPLPHPSSRTTLRRS